MDEAIINMLAGLTIGTGIFPLFFRANRRAVGRFFKRLFRISSPNRSLQDEAPGPDPIADMVETKRRIRAEGKKAWADQVAESVRWMDISDLQKYEIAQRLGAQLSYNHPLSLAAQKERSSATRRLRERARKNANMIREVTELRCLQGNLLRTTDSDV